MKTSSSRPACRSAPKLARARAGARARASLWRERLRGSHRRFFRALRGAADVDARIVGASRGLAGGAPGSPQASEKQHSPSLLALETAQGGPTLLARGSPTSANCGREVRPGLLGMPRRRKGSTRSNTGARKPPADLGRVLGAGASLTLRWQAPLADDDDDGRRLRRLTAAATMTVTAARRRVSGRSRPAAGRPEE